MCALYSFSRKTDDLGDSDRPSTERSNALNRWRESLQSALAGDFHDPLLPAVVDTLRRFDIPNSHLFDVIDGVTYRIDLTQPPKYDPKGNPITEDEFKAKRAEWLPSPDDKAYVMNLMKPVLEPGKMANWISAPARGINGKPIEFEYIRRA